MSNPKEVPWTPAPWRLDHMSMAHVVDDEYHSIQAGGYDDESDEFSGFNLTGYMSPADARLIAAAPEMAELLNTLVAKLAELAIVDGFTNDDCWEYINSEVEEAQKLLNRIGRGK